MFILNVIITYVKRKTFAKVLVVNLQVACLVTDFSATVRAILQMVQPVCLPITEAKLFLCLVKCDTSK